MRTLIVMVAVLGCASCGGGTSSSASANPPAASAASDSTAAPTMPAPAPAPAPATSAPSSTSPAAPVYKIIEIPRLAATGSMSANAVNTSGVVVGDQETTGAPRAWMYQQSSGTLNELTLDPSESGASASGISDSGVIAGYEVPAGGPPLAGFWTVTGGAMLLPGQYQDFTQAVAANGNGIIVGNYAQSGTIASQPLVWSAPGYAQTTLPGLRCDQCVRINVSASAVNGTGLIAGSSTYGIYSSDGSTYVSSGMHAVEWQNGAITDLGGLQGADYSAAYGVNDNGDVVGGSRTDPSSGAPTHAFLYSQGTLTDLGTLDGDTGSSANSINDNGEIVGVSQGDSSKRAFLYANGHLYDLNSLIDPASGLAGIVSLEEAVSVNANGWIAANGTDSRDPGWRRAFLLIPAQ